MIDMASNPTASQLERGPHSHDLSDIGLSQPPWANPELLYGFPQIAHYLAADPNKSALNFRRFDKVSIRNLLNLEGRIAALETLQEELDREDYTRHGTNKDIATIARSWKTLLF